LPATVGIRAQRGDARSIDAERATWARRLGRSAVGVWRCYTNTYTGSAERGVGTRGATAPTRTGRIVDGHAATTEAYASSRARRPGRTTSTRAVRQDARASNASMADGTWAAGIATHACDWQKSALALFAQLGGEAWLAAGAAVLRKANRDAITVDALQAGPARHASSAALCVLKVKTLPSEALLRGRAPRPVSAAVAR
jgi:hypothetical protein